MGWVNLLRENAGKLHLLRFLSGKSAAFLAVEIKTSFTRITVDHYGYVRVFFFPRRKTVSQAETTIF